MVWIGTESSQLPSLGNLIMSLPNRFEDKPLSMNVLQPSSSSIATCDIGNSYNTISDTDVYEDLTNIHQLTQKLTKLYRIQVFLSCPSALLSNNSESKKLIEAKLKEILAHHY